MTPTSKSKTEVFEYREIRKSLPMQLSGILLIVISVKEKVLAELSKFESGVTTKDSFPVHAVVWATPWPNSTAVFEFKFIFDASVEPNAKIPITNVAYDK